MSKRRTIGAILNDLGVCGNAEWYWDFGTDWEMAFAEAYTSDLDYLVSVLNHLTPLAKSISSKPVEFIGRHSKDYDPRDYGLTLEMLIEAIKIEGVSVFEQ